jgi:nucleotide sugar dehydrogenase
VAAAVAGHRVIGYDVDPRHVERLKAGQSSTEDVSDLRLKEAMVTGALRFTTDPAQLRQCHNYIICVPTPLRDRAPDLSMVMSAVDAVGANLAPGDLVVLESTTYPGTTEDLVAPRLVQATGLEAGRHYHLAFSPERIDPGNPTHGIVNTPKIVGGVGTKATQVAVEFYESFVEKVHAVSSPREAEMAKLLENTFRHVNIALVNEMAVFCQELGIDLWEAIDAAATKPFGFMAFRPGPGVGGHCIPIDPSYLSWHVRRRGYSFRFVELACEINDHMPGYVAVRAGELLNRERKPVNGSKILVLGIAYKQDIGDVRETSAVALVRRLIGMGAEVSWHDPHVGRQETLETGTQRLLELSAEVLRGFDLVIIHTDHSTYDWPWIVQHAALVLDTRNVAAALADPRIGRL